MQASTELRNIIAGWFESVAKGDLSWADRHISRSDGVRLVLVGTDYIEFLKDEKVAEFLKEEVKEMGGVVTVSLGEIEAYQEGSVGWGLACPTITLPGGQQYSLRWSAVFHQEDGEWKLVQLHASVIIPNQQQMG